MLLTALCLVAAQTAPELPPDRITLTSGKVVEGVLLRADDDVVLLGDGSRNEEIKRDKIASFSGPRVAYFKDYIARLEYVYSEQAGAQDALELADWCRAHGLLRSERLHLWHAIEIDPSFSAAHERLGHRQRGDEVWEHRTETGTWLDMEELQARRLEFHDPWHFDTMHFEVVAAGPLGDVLDACATMEAVYYRFYTLLQRDGKFLELRTPIRVQLYRARDADYPEVSPTVAGYYDKNSFILHGFFDGPRVANLVRTTVQAVFERSAYELTRSPPTLAGWLYEGIPTYFTTCFEESEGVPVWWDARMDARYFRYHGDFEEPESVDRIVDLVESDFDGVSDATLLYAQSYTLFYWFLHAASDDEQKAFRSYLADAWLSRGTGSHLKKAIGRKAWRGVDKAWNDFVDEAVRRQT